MMYSPTKISSCPRDFLSMTGVLLLHHNVPGICGAQAAHRLTVSFGFIITSHVTMHIVIIGILVNISQCYSDHFLACVHYPICSQLAAYLPHFYTLQFYRPITVYFFLAHGKKCNDILTFGFNILLSLTRHGQLIRILLRTWIRIAASRLLLNIKSNSVAFRVYATRKMHPQSRKSPIKTKLLDRKIGGSTEICLDVPQVQKHQKDNLSCVHAEAKCRAQIGTVL